MAKAGGSVCSAVVEKQSEVVIRQRKRKRVEGNTRRS
jgi:hypothetical protein